LTDTGYGKNWNPSLAYQDISVAESYDRQRFTSLAGRVFDRLEKRILRKAFAGLRPNATIADVPCGTGRLAEALLEYGHRVHGFDISPQMLAVAARKLGRFGDRFKPWVRDARELAAHEERFDGALCARVLMHFPFAEQVEFLKSVAAVTDGPVVFSQGLDTPLQRLRRRVKRLLKHQNPAIYPLKPVEMKELIKAAGLREVRRFYVMPIVSEAVIVVTVRA
jgi:2-polyprenyl-3-methyl-5-hydroxy-6-metoxy-1,4-benzoquinol methylase